MGCLKDVRKKLVILVNNMLDSLPTYMMSLFPLPANIEKKNDALRRNFIWQGNREKKGFYLGKWKTLTISNKEGGLGIRNLRYHNRSLLMKWLWRFSLEEKAFGEGLSMKNMGMRDTGAPK